MTSQKSFFILYEKSIWISAPKLLYESPGGNLVDGSPPAAHTNAGPQAPPVLPYKTGPRRPLTRACSRSIRHIVMILWGSFNICMISILTKGRDIPRDGCGGHPGGEQCFSDGVNNQDSVLVPELILDASRSH